MLQRLHGSIGKVRPAKQLAPWLYGLARRVLQARASPEAPSACQVELPKTADPADLDQLAGALAPFTETLPPDLAEILRLTDFGPLTQQAAAEKLGLTKTALKSRADSGRRRLRAAVAAGCALALEAAETVPTAPADPGDIAEDCPPPRRRVPVAMLRSDFEAGLAQLVAPWVAEPEAPSVVAEVLRRLHEGMSRLPHNGRMALWVYAVARGALLDRDLDPTAQPALERLRAALPDRPTPEARAALSEAVLPFLDALTAEQVEAIRLVDVEGLSQQEAADRLGLHTETLKQRLWKGRRVALQALQRAMPVRRPARRSAEGAAPLAAAPASEPAPVRLVRALRVFVARLAPAAAVDPVVGEVYRRLRQEAATRRPSSSMFEWFYATVRVALEASWRPALGAHRGHEATSPPPERPDPSATAALAACLAPFLGTLMREQAEACRLIDLEGLPLLTAAAQVGTDRPTFQGRLQRARIRLRGLLEACLALAAPSRPAPDQPAPVVDE